MPKYKVTLSDGSSKTIFWNKSTEPSDQELIDAPEYVESKPSISQRFIKGITDPATSLYEYVQSAATNVPKHLREGNYPAALHDVASPILTPFEGIENFLISGKKSIPNPGTQIAEQAGIPLSLMKMPLTEHGPYPLRDNPSPIGPINETSFEGLTKGPETPKVNWQDYQQQGLGLEFDPRETQPKLLGMDKTPQQASFDALIPNRYKPHLAEKLQPEIPGPLEPKIAGLNRPTWSSFAQQRKLPLDYDLIQNAETSGIPELQKAAQQVVERTATFTRDKGWVNPNKSSNLKQVANDWLRSDYESLVKDSPAGKGIANLIDRYRHESASTSGKISATLKDVIEPLTKDQYNQFQHYLDTGDDLPSSNTNVNTFDNVGSSNRAKLQDTNLPPTIDTSRIELPPEFADSMGNLPQYNRPPIDPMVQNALDVARTIDKEFTQRAIASGIHLRLPSGETIPFTGKENYWPRMYSPEMFKDKPALVERLIKQGMAPETAVKAISNMRRFGERLIDPQNARVLDLPEHRKDLGALLKHYDDMSHRVAAAEIFGVKDIADPSTPISQLVADTRNPTNVSKILTQYLDRDSGVAPHEADFDKGINRKITALYLSRFAISNSNQLAMILVVTNFKSTGKFIAQFVKSPKNTWREAEATGALQTVMQEALREAGGESIVSKAYGIKASEGANRTISAIAGKYYLQDLFSKAKRGNIRAQKSLQDLTLDSWDSIKNQDTLSEKQIAYGANSVVEKTQGRAQSIDLPYNWSRSPYTGLLLLYKKYAFVQGRLIKDALKVNKDQPLSITNVDPKKVALIMGLFQATGEMTGDTKAAISGIFSGDPGQAVEDRGKYINSSSKILNRMTQNYVDSMFLGLAGDALMAFKGGKQAILETVVGPVIGLGAETLGNKV